MQLTVPPSVTQNLARVKSLLGRGETIRALDSFLAAIGLFEEAQIVGRARAGAEIVFRECVDLCNRNAQIRNLIKEIAKSDTAVIAYTAGQESQLASVLRILRKGLAEAETAKEQAALAEAENRREAMFAKALEYFSAGEAPKGRAMLRKIGDEFGGEPGILARVGHILAETDFMPDAVPYFEQAITDFPRDSAPYSELAGCYLKLHEYEKAETLYMAAIRTFGAHPRTLTNLGRLYLTWNKRDKAFEALQQAQRHAPESEEIAALLAKAER